MYGLFTALVFLGAMCAMWVCELLEYQALTQTTSTHQSEAENQPILGGQQPTPLAPTGGYQGPPLRGLSGHAGYSGYSIHTSADGVDNGQSLL